MHLCKLFEVKTVISRRSFLITAPLIITHEWKNCNAARIQNSVSIELPNTDFKTACVRLKEVLGMDISIPSQLRSKRICLYTRDATTDNLRAWFEFLLNRGSDPKLYKLMPGTGATTNIEILPTESFFTVVSKNRDIPRVEMDLLFKNVGQFISNSSAAGLPKSITKTTSPNSKLILALIAKTNIRTPKPIGSAAYRVDLSQLGKPLVDFAKYRITQQSDPGAANANNTSSNDMVEIEARRIIEANRDAYLIVASSDHQYRFVGRPYEYSVYLRNVINDMCLTINPLNLFEWDSVDAFDPTDNQDNIDLNVHFDKNPKLRRDRLSDVLLAFHLTTGDSVLSDTSFKIGHRNFAPNIQSRLLSGKPTKIINSICKNWELQGVKHERTWILWSTSWMFDQDFEIQASKLQRWEKRATQKGKFTDEDYQECASELTWGQMSVALRQYFTHDLGLLADKYPMPEIEEYADYCRFRIKSMMSRELKSALSNGGLIHFKLLDPRIQELLIGSYLSRLALPLIPSDESAYIEKLYNTQLGITRSGRFTLS